jgi:hypothetical protein
VRGRESQKDCLGRCEDASLKRTVFRYVDAESYGNVTSQELWSRYLDGYCDLLPDEETYDVMNKLVARGFEPCEDASLKKTLGRCEDASLKTLGRCEDASLKKTV